MMIPSRVVQAPQGPRRLRVSVSAKAVRPSPPNSSGRLGADATCQRVIATLGARVALWRSSRPSAPPSRAASESRRVAVRSASCGHLRDHAGERAAFQRLLHGEQRIDRPRHAHDQQLVGGKPDEVEAGAVERAGFVACRNRSRSRAFPSRARCARTASVSAKPAAAPRWTADAALSSCSAAHGRPPPSAASISATPSASVRASSANVSADRDRAPQALQLRLGRLHGGVQCSCFVLIDSPWEGESQATPQEG